MLFFEIPVRVGKKEKAVLVIFAGQMVGHEADYAYDLEVGFRENRISPEEVVFLCPGYLREKVNEYLAREEKFYDGLLRFGRNIPVSIAFFDEYADFEILSVNKKGIDQKDAGRLKDLVIRHGLMELAKNKKDQIILKAPSGTIFLKPSSKEFSEFIKTGELAVGASENQFVAFCLLSKRPRDRKIRKIYIDTNSISPFIEALLFYLSCFQEKLYRVATYYSYGSYSGKDKAKPDIIDDVWLIISASRSNSMGRKMAEEWGLSDQQVLTILSYTDPDPEVVGDDILLNISSFSGSHKDLNKKGSLIKVKVVGENFTAEAEKPNSVTIKSKHKSGSISKSIEPLNALSAFRCNKKVVADEKALPVYVDCARYFVENEKFRDWLFKILDWYVPIKISHVVYREVDEASVSLKKLVVERLQYNGIENFTVTDLSSAALEVSGDESIVIVMPVTGSGETLLKLNRNLRISGHNGNRIFISPFVVHSSRSSFLNFKNSLLYGPEGLKYQFFSCHEVFVGHDKEPTSWDLELDLIESFDDEFWRKRASQLRNLNEGLCGRIGVNSTNPECCLGFSQDFAFWNSRYEVEKVNHEAVYVTISAILQNLREIPLSDDDSDSLFSYVYQHSVLSPENFVRFNDSLLQSCIWRAADSRELDYRSSDEISREFIEILERLVIECAQGKDNAAVDLLIGIAVGRIQLSKDVLLPALKRFEDRYSDDFKHVHKVLDFIKSDFELGNSYDQDIPF